MPPDPLPTPPPLGPRPTPLAVVSIASIATAVGLGSLQFFSPGKAGDVPSIFGTVSSWISAGGIMGILSLLVWLQLGNRKITVEQVGIDNLDKADIRDHYATEVAALRKRIDQQATNHATRVADLENRYQRNVAEVESRYATALQAAEDRHQECERQRTDQFEEIRALKDKVAGLERQQLAASADRVIAFGEPGSRPPSVDVVDAAHRIKDRLDNGGDGEGDAG